MKKGSIFIIILCLIIAIGSLSIAFVPMIKNLKPADETTALPDGSDISSDLNDSDDVSSDVPGDESSDVGSDESDVPGDESSDAGSDESDVPGDESSDIGSDESDSNIPEVQGYTVHISACRDNNSSGDLKISYFNSLGEPVEVVFENPGVWSEEDEEITLDTTDYINDVAAELTFDFSNYGFIQVYDSEEMLIYDGSSESTGIYTVTVSSDTSFRIVGIYN